jgi:hypothetical protein
MQRLVNGSTLTIVRDEKGQVDRIISRQDGQQETARRIQSAESVLVMPKRRSSNNSVRVGDIPLLGRIVGKPYKCCGFVDGGWPGHVMRSQIVLSLVQSAARICSSVSRPLCSIVSRNSGQEAVARRLEHAIGFFADAVTGELSLPVQRLVPTINSMNRARHRPTGRNALGTARRDRERLR